MISVQNSAQPGWQLRMRDPAIWLALFAAVYLAVLPMAGTIALLAILVILTARFMDIRPDRRLGLPVLAWA